MPFLVDLPCKVGAYLQLVAFIYSTTTTPWQHRECLDYVELEETLPNAKDGAIHFVYIKGITIN